MQDGYCAIVGRIKDMVIRGGENVYPREIEEFLYTHPAIVDVQVFGVPDKRFGEELCAWIKLRAGTKLTEDDVKAYLQGPDRPLQGPALRPVRGRIPHDRHREDAEISDACDNGRGTGFELKRGNTMRWARFDQNGAAVLRGCRGRHPHSGPRLSVRRLGAHEPETTTWRT